MRGLRGPLRPAGARGGHRGVRSRRSAGSSSDVREARAADGEQCPGGHRREDVRSRTGRSVDGAAAILVLQDAAAVQQEALDELRVSVQRVYLLLRQVLVVDISFV